MNFAYFAYFLLIPAAGVVLMRKARMYQVKKLLFSCMLGYYMCFIIFHLFPIAGPVHAFGHLPRVERQGGPFTFLVEKLQDVGGIHGGAFPSSHVAAATVVLIFLWLHERKAVWVFGPLVISLYISTVFLGYHYASDVFGGIIVGVFAVALGSVFGTQHANILCSCKN
jgi:membrane-associated phospholipid phosphatase